METSVPSELRDFLASLPIALSLASIEGDHPLLFVNQRFTDLTGYSNDDLVGRNCRFLQGDARDGQAHAKFRAFLQNDDTMAARAPIINFRRDGSAFVNLLYLTRLRAESGEARYLLGSQFDVTRVEVDRLRAYDKDLAEALAGFAPLSVGCGIAIDDALAVIGDSVSLMAQAHFRLLDPSSSFN
ncbi:MAG: PAS domain-containing protein [Novosphingobium sp.]